MLGFILLLFLISNLRLGTDTGTAGPYGRFLCRRDISVVGGVGWPAAICTSRVPTITRHFFVKGSVWAIRSEGAAGAGGEK